MKYELVTADTITLNSRQTLTRIRALIDIPKYKVNKGDLGGYVKNEKNLSQRGTAWIGGNARVFDNAKVFGNAHVFGEAIATNNTQVFGKAEVHGESSLSGDAKILDRKSVV